MGAAPGGVNVGARIRGRSSRGASEPRIQDPRIAARMLPDFLCIGAQKAGTTWLHGNLIQHPDLWLPPAKELHYFDRAERYPSPLSRKFYDDRWRQELARRARERWRERSLSGLRRDLDYLFGRRDHAWYARVFEPGRGKLCGEVTPAYSKLDAEHVARIAALLPEARILFLMRDPIDRAWSSARMSSDRRGLDLGDEARWKGHLDTQRGKRGDYLRTLRQWRAHYPPERFFVGFFEDVEQRPAELLLRVLDFLGARADPALLPPTLGERFNPSTVVPLPPAAERHLAELYLEDLEALADEFGAPASDWLARARRVLARDPSALSGRG